MLPCPEGIGDPLFLIQDPQATSADAAMSARTPLAATAGVAQAYVVGRTGIAAVLSRSTAYEVWQDFVAVEDYDSALRLLDEVEIDLRFTRAEQLEAAAAPSLHGAGSGGDLSLLREMALDSGGLDEAVWDRLEQLQVAKGRVRLAQAEAARDAGADPALGRLPAIVDMLWSFSRA